MPLLAPRALNAWESLTARLRGIGEWLPPFVLRLVMGYEFWESGIEKYRGENWFADLQSSFPFPFDVMPPAVSWQIATWFELVGAVALWLGFGTRCFAFGLLFLTFVATAAVHWPDMWAMWSDLLQGYAVTDRGHGNFKLPLLFAVMLLPLIFNGAGKLSLDHLLGSTLHLDAAPEPLADAYAFAIGAAVIGVPFLMLIPTLGTALLGLALAFALFGRFARA